MSFMSVPASHFTSSSLPFPFNKIALSVAVCTISRVKSANRNFVNSGAKTTSYLFAHQPNSVYLLCSNFEMYSISGQ